MLMPSSVLAAGGAVNWEVAGLRGHHMAPCAQGAQILWRIIVEQAGQPASGRPPARFLCILMLVRARGVVEGEHAFA